MAAPQSIDDLLVCLMSMGFDWQDCQDAVQSGKVTVETAVEWLLAGKPGFQGTETSAPSLDLRPSISNFDEGANPFANPISLPKDTDVSVTNDNNDVTSNQSKDRSDGDGEDNQSESGILSRLHLSNEQRKIKQHFEKKQRDEAKQVAKKEKQMRKRDHDRILKEIAEDREKQKQIHGASKLSSDGTDSPVKSEEKSETNKPAAKEETATKSPQPATSSASDMCLLRIRNPDGVSTRTSMPATSCLRDVWEFMHIPDRSSYCFIQPFPHREFGQADMDSTLQELGLTPTGSLVLQKKEISQSVTESAKAAAPDVRDVSMIPDVRSSGPLSSGSGHGAVQSQELPPVLPGMPPVIPGMPPVIPGMPPDIPGMPPNMPGFPGLGGPGLPPGLGPGAGAHEDTKEWGPGHRLDTPAEAEGSIDDPVDDESDAEINDDDMAVVGHGIPPGGPAGFLGGAGAWGGGNNMDDDAMSFWGVGQRLVPEGLPHSSEGQHHNRPAKELAAEKARERFSKPAEPNQVVQDNTAAHNTLTYNVEQLLLLCMSHVAHRLNDPRHLIRSLSGISEDLAQKLLQHLLRQKLLKPKTLNAFIPCFLRKLVLDCYPYTTNELLQSTRLHIHLQTLSMRSCPLITDAGLQAITGLKKLKNLNLSSCKQLTDKCLPVIQELQCITSLNLEDTGITEEGLIKYLDTCPQCLQHLNLNRTKVTEKIFSHLRSLPALKALYMEQTQVSGLSGIQELKQLETLDVSHTDIVTDSLLCLRENTSLTCLSISHTDKVNGDTALEYLSCLKLQAINLPSRHTTTDRGMKYLSGFPLTVLDLTNFRNVGNTGMQFIGQIKSLKRLLLINTSITDEGMFYLEGLKQLDVLYLDRTDITDEGASVLKEFTHLQELSLASTRVTSKFLLDGVLDNCYYLSKLNLSSTGVTTKGVRRIELGSLTLLNLESTAVKPFVVELLYSKCPKLKNVIATNLIPVDGSIDDDDNSMES